MSAAPVKFPDAWLLDHAAHRMHPALTTFPCWAILWDHSLLKTTLCFVRALVSFHFQVLAVPLNQGYNASPRFLSRAGPQCTGPQGRPAQSPRAPAPRGCSACGWRPSCLPAHCTPLHTHSSMAFNQQPHFVPPHLYSASHTCRVSFTFQSTSTTPSPDVFWDGRHSEGLAEVGWDCLW